MSLDISSDSTLLASGSADKNVKLWGLDFGDCHKSIFAHSDSIMQVRFVPQTHYLFTCSKDKTIKEWDGDKFEQIQKLDGHHGEIWALAVARWGNFVVSAGHDRSIRLWNKSEEQIFLEEEQEKDMEELMETEMFAEKDHNDDDNEVGPATKTTAETLKAGEKILEALELAEGERKKMQEYEKVGPIKTGSRGRSCC
jgi:U3 small nucleolar RNA-associated protein 12